MTQRQRALGRAAAVDSHDEPNRERAQLMQLLPGGRVEMDRYAALCATGNVVMGEADDEAPQELLGRVQADAAAVDDRDRGRGSLREPVPDRAASTECRTRCADAPRWW